MKKALVATALLVLAAFAIWPFRTDGGPAMAAAPPQTPAPPVGRNPAIDRPPVVPSSGAASPMAELSAAEKAGRIARIKRDYEDLAAKLGAEFAAAGNNFPGGLNAYLRQLALLEREKRRDFAEFLAPAELEDLEMRETLAGKAVQQWLAGENVTEADRRAVFRERQAFDDKYALLFDLQAPSLLARERDRQAMQDRILGLIGPEKMAAWLGSEGADFGKMASLVAERGLPPSSALELWRVKNQLTLRNLEIAAAAAGLPHDQESAQRGAAKADARARAAGIVGSLEDVSSDALPWLTLPQAVK